MSIRAPVRMRSDEPPPPARPAAATPAHDAEFAQVEEVVCRDITGLRVGVIGNVDSGKSTLVGVLTRCQLDDGRGSARSNVFIHKHEHESGRTSSIDVELMGFAHGEQVAPPKARKTAAHQGWAEVMRNSDRSVTLIDMCGHKKYLKTTVFGMTGMLPEYCMVTVGANMGVSRMTREHIGIAVSLQIPIAVVVTKVDICPTKVFEETMQQVQRIIRRAAKMAFIVRSRDEVRTVAEGMASGRVAPVFTVSNVTGEGMELVRALLATLPPRCALPISRGPVLADPASAAAAAAAEATTAASAEEGRVDAHASLATLPAEFHIDSTYLITGVGLVLAGTLVTGRVAANQTMLLGPDRAGEFRPVLVRTIHSHRVPLASVGTGQSAAFAIRSLVKKDALKRTDIRKGTMLLAPELEPFAVWEFDAEVLVLHHQTTIAVGYAPQVHCGVVRQAAKIVGIELLRPAVSRDSIDETEGGGGAAVTAATADAPAGPVLRTGERAKVRFRFLYYAEYLVPGRMILFREGSAKGVGRILSVDRMARRRGEESGTRD